MNFETSKDNREDIQHQQTTQKNNKNYYQQITLSVCIVCVQTENNEIHTSTSYMYVDQVTQKLKSYLSPYHNNICVCREKYWKSLF